MYVKLKYKFSKILKGFQKKLVTEGAVGKRNALTLQTLENFQPPIPPASPPVHL